MALRTLACLLAAVASSAQLTCKDTRAIPDSLIGTGNVDTSMTPGGENLPFEASANYTMLSSGLYVWDKPVLLSLCASSSAAGNPLGTTNVLFVGEAKVVLFPGTAPITLPVTLCAQVGLITTSDPGVSNVRFNLSVDPTAGCPSGEFPSEFQIPDFQVGRTPSAVNSCPTAAIMPKVLLGSGQIETDLIPIPIDIGYNFQGIFAGTLAILPNAVSQSVLGNMLIATLCPSNATALPAEASQGAADAYEVVFSGLESDSNTTICSWMKRDGDALVAVVSGYGGECPTNWTTGAVRVESFYPPANGAEGGRSTTSVFGTFGVGLVSALMAVAVAAASALAKEEDEGEEEMRK